MFNVPNLKSRILNSKSKDSYSSYRSPQSVRPFTYKHWEGISMQKAVEAVETSGLSFRRASELYNVPKSSSHDRVSGKVKVDAKAGRDPYLTSAEEEELVHFIMKCSEIGYGYTRKQILSLVQRIVTEKGNEVSVSNGWWERFKQRHPQLTLRTPAPVSFSRAAATDSEVFENYFNLLEETLKANDIFDKPASLFNFDESGLPLNPKSLKIACSVGSKNPSYLTSDCRSQITVLACTSAAGYCIPPFVIFDRKTLNPVMTEGEVPGTLYGLSKNGWIDKDLFRDWFFRHFLAYAPPIRPLLLLMDGHSTHYCPDVIKEAAEQKVIVFVLPPNTTHISQPLDKGPFSPLKVAYRQMCHEFMCNNPGRQITRYDFSKIFSSAWYTAMTMRNIMAGFKVTGVCPFNRDIFQLRTNQYTSFKPDTLPERTGLAYSPRRYSTKYMHSTVSHPNLSPVDVVDSRYSFIDHPTSSYLSDSDDEQIERCDDANLDCVVMNPIKSYTSISKHLNIPMSPKKILKKILKKSLVEY